MKLLGNSVHLMKLLFVMLILGAFFGFGQGPPECTSLSVPVNGATEVSVDTDLEWVAAVGADGYLLSIGTTPGGNDILDDEDVGNTTVYNLEEDLPAEQTIFVSIIPYNTTGNNLSCDEVQFTTQSSANVPSCTELLFPGHAQNGISLSPTITWEPIGSATGYLLTVGITNGVFLLNGSDVGNATQYQLGGLSAGTTYYVAIVPYNSMGSAVNCGVESSFTTQGETALTVECTMLQSPLNNSDDVSLNPTLRWAAKPNAVSYVIRAGTAPGASDLLDKLDVGAVTSYMFTEELPSGSRIYVTITPYATNGTLQDCAEESFRTKEIELTVDIEAPRFFTPNNDGFNDTWVVNSSDNITVEGVSIFDRHGKLLKQLNPGQGWNGTFKGRSLPADSYWYELRLLNAPTIKGYFLLKR